MDDFLFAAFLLTLVVSLIAGLWLLIGRASWLRRALGLFILVGATSYFTLLAYCDECGTDCGSGCSATELAFWISLAGIAVCAVLGIVQVRRRPESPRHPDARSAPRP